MRPWEKAAVMFLLRHLAAGAAGGFAMATGMLAFDVGGIGTLVFNSDSIFVALYLLYGSLFVTFGSVAMGIGIMNLNEDTRP